MFERYLAWQRELEREPTDLFYRRLPDLLADVREPLAAFLGARAEVVALARNATSALDSVIRSLALDLDRLGADVNAGNCHKWRESLPLNRRPG